MNIKRWIARKLGYGSVEWPHSHILDLPAKVIGNSLLESYMNRPDFIQVNRYPGGIQTVNGEIGTDGKYRILYYG